MRNLMLLLILANLGVFSWHAWFADSDASDLQGRVVVQAGPSLLLVGETNAPEVPAAEVVATTDSDDLNDTAVAVPEEVLDTAQGDDVATTLSLAEQATATTTGPDTDIVALVCVTLGPLDQETTAVLLREQLAANGFAASISSTGGQIRSGYWVYLPPFGTRAEALRTQDQLREKGVEDLFIVTGDEQRNAISLGLFSTADRADQRAAQIGRLGYSPRIAERFRDATVYWLNWRESPDATLSPDMLRAPGVTEILPEKRIVPCAQGN